MKHARLVKAMEKAGLVISTTAQGKHSVQREHRIVTWYTQGDNAICVLCGDISDPSDAMIDYFPGWYAHTIKSAVEYATATGAYVWAKRGGVTADRYGFPTPQDLKNGNSD